MTHINSTNSAGAFSVQFRTSGGAAIDLSGYAIEAAVLAEINGAPVTVADGGLTVTGGADGVLAFALPDGHGLAAGTYYVHTRYHAGDGNWKDLSKDRIAIAARGGVGSHVNLFAAFGAVATQAVVALVSLPNQIDGGAADTTYENNLLDGGSA